MPQAGGPRQRHSHQARRQAGARGVLILEARSLTKYYDRTAAVRGVSFTIRPGEILGYLGPNGAGKSTTVKMLTGLIERVPITFWSNPATPSFGW